MTDQPTAGRNVSEIQTFLDRISKLEDDQSLIAEDIKEVWAEAKGRGFNIKAMRRAYALSKLKTEELADVKLYADTLGIFG